MPSGTTAAWEVPPPATDRRFLEELLRQVQALERSLADMLAGMPASRSLRDNGGSRL
jgi:hypothetical protein